MPSYSESNPLTQFGADLIQRYHPGLSSLRIGFLFRDKSSHSQGKIVPARTRRCEDRDRTFHNLDFVIEVAREVWDEADLRFREAILDHELTSIGIHCDEDGTPQENTDGRIKTFNRKPDIMEYHEVMARHGAYHVELREFLTTLEQKENPDTKTEEADTPAEDTSAIAEVANEFVEVVGEVEEDVVTADSVEIVDDSDEDQEQIDADVEELMLTLDGSVGIEFEEVGDDADFRLPEFD